MKFRTRKQLKQEIKNLSRKLEYWHDEAVKERSRKEALWHHACRDCPIYRTHGNIQPLMKCDYYPCPIYCKAMGFKEPSNE